MVSKYMLDKMKSSSAIRKMFEEGKEMIAKVGEENVFDFSLGNPNVKPPEAVNKSVKEILDRYAAGDIHGYMNNSGYLDVRDKLAAYENRTKGTDLAQQDIIMTCGAAGGLNVLFRCLLNPGEEVLTFAPFFSEYRPYINNHNGVLNVVPANPPSFQPDLLAFKEMISENTKIVLINSPNNPTGVVYTEEAIVGIANIMKEKEAEYGHSIILVSDEPYREIVYIDQELPYILNYYDNSVVVYSYSKSLSLPGERIGYISVSPKIDEHDTLLDALNVANRILGFINANSLFQRVAAEVSGETVNVEFYKKNRDLLCGLFDELGVSYAKPDGTFYLFVQSPIEDEIAFCNKAKEFNLLIVPARGFGCPGYVRMAYCTSHDKVERSLGAIRRLFECYK